MPSDSTIAVKVVFAISDARKGIGLNEIARKTGIVKSLVFYHLKKLMENNIILRDGDKYTCQPFYSDKEIRDDLSSLAKSLINMLAKEMVIDTDATEEELGEQILQNTHMFLSLYKEGLFS